MFNPSLSATNRLEVAFCDQCPSSIWSRWSLPLSLILHFSHYLTENKHTWTQSWELFTQEISVCVHASDLGVLVGMCTWCSDMERSAEITHCGAFVCLCVCICVSVTGPCHSITGHTNLIIQLWAQWAGIYERDCSAGEHKPQSVTTLPFCSVTSRVWADSDSLQLFPRLITVGVSSLSIQFRDLSNSSSTCYCKQVVTSGLANTLRSFWYLEDVQVWWGTGASQR